MDLDYSERRARIAKTLNLTDEVLLVGAGYVLSKPEISDQRLPFIAHQEYFYLTGSTEAIGGILAFDPRDLAAGLAEDGWISFVPKVTEDQIIWEGREQLPGPFLPQLRTWLAARKGRSVIMLGTPVPGLATDHARTVEARELILHARRPKDPAEIDLMRHCAYKTASGYATIVPMLKAGVSERRIQVEIEAEYFRRGADKTGYDTIVGSGPNAAIFHASPSQRTVKPGEFILIDSGAEIERYVIDVTRTYVAGIPTPFQRDLYQTVLSAQLRAIARCVPGTEWKAIHYGAAVDLVAGLVAMGVMIGDPANLVAEDAHLLFFPHGIGHMVGLGVRDASGMDPGRTKDTSPAFATLRMDLILRSRYIVTVEPGLYFIPAILNNPANREKFRDCVNWPLVEQHLSLGGVRLEDTVLVTAGPPEVLTRMIPKVL